MNANAASGDEIWLNTGGAVVAGLRPIALDPMAPTPAEIAGAPPAGSAVTIPSPIVRAILSIAVEAISRKVTVVAEEEASNDFHVREDHLQLIFPMQRD